MTSRNAFVLVTLSWLVGLAMATAQAAMAPVHSPSTQTNGANGPIAVPPLSRPADESLPLSTRSSLDGTSVPGRPGLRDTGVCDPPVGGPEPIGCTTNGDCAGFGPETCGTNGFCDYAPITTCGSDDCVGKGTAKRLSRRYVPPKYWPAAGSIRVFMWEALVMTGTFDVTDTGT